MNSTEPPIVLTIGHSNLPYARFISLLKNAGVTAVADVRSAPYSRHFQHFNREALHEGLRTDGIAYVFLGRELGGRPTSSNFFCEGIADYEKMAAASSFKEGIKRVIHGATRHRIALMCSEHDPLDCHRCLLVGRALIEQRVLVKHISSKGCQISQEKIEDALLFASGRSTDDLFVSRHQRLAAAYKDRARKVAFAIDSTMRQVSAAAE